MSLGAGDLIAALCDLHERFGCERSSAAFRLADGVLMTVALEHANLTITRDDGAAPMTVSGAATIADLRAMQRRRRR